MVIVVPIALDAGFGVLTGRRQPAPYITKKGSIQIDLSPRNVTIGSNENTDKEHLKAPLMMKAVSWPARVQPGSRLGPCQRAHGANPARQSDVHWPADIGAPPRWRSAPPREGIMLLRIWGSLLVRGDRVLASPDEHIRVFSRRGRFGCTE